MVVISEVEYTGNRNYAAALIRLPRDDVALFKRAVEMRKECWAIRAKAYDAVINGTKRGARCASQMTQA